MKNYKNKMGSKYIFILAFCLNGLLIDTSFALTNKTIESLSDHSFNEAKLMDPVGAGKDYLKISEQNIDRFNILCKKTVSLQRLSYNWTRNDALLYKLTRFFITENAGYKVESINYFTNQFTVAKIGENPVRVLNNLESTVNRFFSTVRSIVGLPLDNNEPLVSFDNEEASSSVCYKINSSGKFER